MSDEFKEKSLMSKFGFQDNDLTTPEHDKIMIWLDEWARTNLGDQIFWEHPIKSESGYVIGFIDMYVCLGLNNINFEVKSKINSLGELLRQIKMYKSFDGDSCEFESYAVVSPDVCQFKDLLKSQRIGYLEYPSCMGEILIESYVNGERKFIWESADRIKMRRKVGL